MDKYMLSEIISYLDLGSLHTMLFVNSDTYDISRKILTEIVKDRQIMSWKTSVRTYIFIQGIPSYTASSLPEKGHINSYGTLITYQQGASYKIFRHYTSSGRFKEFIASRTLLFTSVYTNNGRKKLYDTIKNCNKSYEVLDYKIIDLRYMLILTGRKQLCMTFKCIDLFKNYITLNNLFVIKFGSNKKSNTKWKTFYDFEHNIKIKNGKAIDLDLVLKCSKLYERETMN